MLCALEAEGLKVSEATLEKDLALLKYQRFAPIEYDASQRCYLYTEDWNFDIPISPAAIKMMHMLLHKLQVFAESREFQDGVTHLYRVHKMNNADLTSDGFSEREIGDKYETAFAK